MQSPIRWIGFLSIAAGCVLTHDLIVDPEARVLPTRSAIFFGPALLGSGLALVLLPGSGPTLRKALLILGTVMAVGGFAGCVTSGFMGFLTFLLVGAPGFALLACVGSWNLAVGRSKQVAETDSHRSDSSDL